MKETLECRKSKNGIPVWELEFHCWDNISGRHVCLGKEFEKLSIYEREKTLYNNAEILVSVSNQLNFSALTVPGEYWEVAPNTPAYYWLPEEAYFDQAKIIHKMAGDSFMLVGVSGGVMAIPNAEQYVEFSLKLFDDPEEIDRLAEQTFNRGIEKAKRMRDAGIQAVVTASDLADNNGLFFNPEQMDRYIIPYLHKWAQKVKELGMYSILHSDGNIYKCLDAIANSGINALQAIDPTAGMVMNEVFRQTQGKICLCGNIDNALLINGPKTSIYEATKILINESDDYPGFILGASNAVISETPKENYYEMLRACHEV